MSTPTRSAPPPPAIDEPSPGGGGIALSIVVPVYNEEENVDELYAELTMVADGLGRTYEIVVIDDGSTDETYPRLTRLATGDPRLKVIHFGRNFGQTAAMSAGFDHAEGAVVVPLDGDLQNDPADIARLLEKLDEGYDVVSRLAQGPQGQRSSPNPLAHGQLAHRPCHWRAPARLRLHAQGLPRPGREGHAALRRDAPLPAGAGLPRRGAGDGASRQPPAAPPRPSRSTASGAPRKCCSTC